MNNKLLAFLLVGVIGLMAIVIIQSESGDIGKDSDYQSTEQTSNSQKEQAKPKPLPLKEEESVIVVTDIVEIEEEEIIEKETKTVKVIEEAIDKDKTIEKDEKLEPVVEDENLKEFLVTVYDKNNKPIKGIKLWVKDHEQLQNNYSKIKSKSQFKLKESDETGKIEFKVPLKGFLFLKIEQKKYSAYEKLNIDLSQENTLSIYLKKSSRITGRVVDSSTDEVIPGVTVSASYGWRMSGSYKTENETDANGNYELFVPHDKTLRLKVYSKEHINRESINVKLKSGEELVKNFELTKGRVALIELVDYDTGDAIPNLEISLKTWKNNRWWEMEGFESKSDDEGILKLKGISNQGDEYCLISDTYEALTFAPNKGSETQKLKLKKGGSLFIAVKNENGEALEEVSFSLNRRRGFNMRDMLLRLLLRSATFDEEKQGHFIRGLSGEYEINVTKEGYKSEKIEFKVENMQTTKMDLILKKGKQIRLSIKNEKGDDIDEEVKVNFLRYYGSGESRIALPTTIDEKKYFTVNKPSKYRSFRVMVEGYIYSEKFEINDDEEWVYDVVLKKGLSLSGVILDENGKPVADGEISLIQQRVTYGKTKSNSSGNFILGGLSEGKYEVSITHPDYQKFQSSAEILGETSEKNFSLKKGLMLKGIVLLPDGKPAENSRVSFVNSGSRMHSYESSSTNEKGEFELSNLEAKRGTLYITNEDYIRIEKVLDLSETVPDKMDFTLSKGFTMTGQVLHEEQPVPNLQLGMYSNSRRSYMAPKSIITDENGNFEVTNLSNKKYSFYLRSEEYVLKKTYSVEVNSDLTGVNLALDKLKQVLGQIFLPDGTLAKEYELFVRQVGTSVERKISRFETVEDNFKIQEKDMYLRNGTQYTILAKAKGFAPAESEPFTQDKLPVKVDLTLKPALKISFEITNSQALGIEGIKVSWIKGKVGDKPPPFNTTQRISSDESGKAVVDNASEGWYTFKFEHEDYIQKIDSFQLLSENQTQYIEMAKGFKLKAKIVSDTNKTVRGGRLWFKGIGDNAHSQFVASKSSGEFHLTGVPAGEYKIHYYPSRLAESMIEWAIPHTSNIIINENLEETLVLGGSALGELGGINGAVESEERVYSVRLKSLEPEKKSEHSSYVRSSKFYFNHIPPGRYIIEGFTISRKKIVSSEFFVSAKQRIDVNVNIDLGNLEIQSK